MGREGVGILNFSDPKYVSRGNSRNPVSRGKSRNAVSLTICSEKSCGLRLDSTIGGNIAVACKEASDERKFDAL